MMGGLCFMLYVLCCMFYDCMFYDGWSVFYVVCFMLGVLCCMFYDCMFCVGWLYVLCFMMGVLWLYVLCFMIVCFMLYVLWWVVCVLWLYVYQTLDLTGHVCMFYVLCCVFYDGCFMTVCFVLGDLGVLWLCVFWWPFSRAPDLLVFTWVAFWGPEMSCLTPPRPRYVYQTLDLTGHVCMFHDCMDCMFYVGWFALYDCVFHDCMDCMFYAGRFVFYVVCFMLGDLRCTTACFVLGDCMILCWVIRATNYFIKLNH